MSNDEILDKRWKKTEKTLKDYLKRIKSVGENIADDILEIFDSIDIDYSDINKYISKLEKRKLDRKISYWNNNGYLTGYLKYLVYSKSKYTYADLIEILIYGMYAEHNRDINEISKEIFIDVANDIYRQALEEKKEKNKKRFSLTWEFIWSLLWIPSYNKSWDDYLELLVLTNEQETYKTILISIQQKKDLKNKDLSMLIRKQMNRLLCINDDKFSGVISDTCRQLGNRIYIEPFKNEKDLQVRFVAELDNKTTKMCESMNNMLFYVNDWNKFYRYSSVDDKNVLYTVKGLEQGINLPPINNHFHWCRSTITYQLDYDSEKLARDNINIATNYDREQYTRYKKYYGKGIPDNVNDFVKMKNENPKKWEALKANYFKVRRKYNNK